MSMLLSLAMFILGHSAAGWSFVALYAQYQRRVLGAVTQSVILLSLVIFEWTIFYAVEIAVADPQLKIAAHHLKHIGMTVLPITGLMFAASYASSSAWLTRRHLVLASIIPALIVVAILTNSFHHLVWSDLQVVKSGELEVVQEVRGVLAWVEILYSYVMFTLIVAVMFHHLRGLKLNQRRYTILLTALLLPGAASLWITFQLSPGDLTPFALTISGMAVAWTLFSFADVLIC
jgi:hypothetical protein